MDVLRDVTYIFSDYARGGGCVLREEGYVRQAPKGFFGVCRRRDGRRLCVVFAAAGD